MCIGTPAIILDVDYGNMTATVDYGDGVPRSVLIGISEEKVKRGDIVVVHAGVVVSRMSEDEILEQIRFFKEALGEEFVSIASTYISLLEKSRVIKGNEV
ncbi:MAG: HypC/HybG/HupF family hydrogenase formation chaperone [Desulfurococcaceae archaeon]